MLRVVVGTFVMVVVLVAWAVSTVAARQPAGARGQYQILKVCALLTVAEVKKLAPWEPMFDQMKIEEEGIAGGSSCSYPTATVQVMQFHQGTIDSLTKQYKLEVVAGVGDAAWLRNNRDMFAELMTKVGPHLLTVQTSIDRGQTFETSKPELLALGRAFAAKLR